MSLLGFVYVLFYNLFFKVFADNYAVPESFTDTRFTYSNIGSIVESRYIEVMDTIYNIFAWIDVFIDLDLVFGLIFLTLLFYGFKFSSSLAKHVMGLFK